MPTIIKSPVIIKAAGNKPKTIEEYVGRVNTKTETLSIARMNSPAGWTEPGQIPEFDEYTIILSGRLTIKTREETIELHAGEAIITHRGEWIQYSTPTPEGAEYIAVCIPAFSPHTVHRDED